MNPHQRNKIDVSKMSPDEQRLFRLYGKVPNTKDLLQNKFKQERKYFDSGDYAMSKAGKAPDAGVTSIGSQHPQPENIPHLSTPANGLNTNNNGNGNGNGADKNNQAGSPVKESSFLHRETSAEEGAERNNPRAEGIPLRYQT